MVLGTVSTSKVTLMLIPTNAKPTSVPEPTNTTINQEALVRLFDFKYLGSTICNNASLDSELRYRVGNASATFGKLHDSKRKTNMWLKQSQLQGLWSRCPFFTPVWFWNIDYISETSEEDPCLHDEASNSQNERTLEEKDHECGNYLPHSTNINDNVVSEKNLSWLGKCIGWLTTDYQNRCRTLNSVWEWVIKGNLV